MGLTQVNSEGIKDGEIKDADVNASAAIALSKLASTPTLLTGSTNNTICTVTGANAIQGEANLTFDGSDLALSRSDNAAGGISVTNTNDAQASGIAQLALSGGDNAYANISLECNGNNHHIKNDNSGNLGILDGATERLRIDSDGRVLIGTTASSSKLHIESTDSRGHQNLLELKHPNTTTTGDGPAILLNGYYSSAEWAFAKISAENRGSGYGADLKVHVHPADGTQGSSVVEAVKITGDGSGASVTVTNGDLVIGTAGHGIDFSATGDSSGTTTSELLDEYEEGTWTGTIKYWDSSLGWHNAGFDTSPSNTTGLYTRVGRIVHVELYINGFDVNSTATGSYAAIAGLPFADTTSDNHYGVISFAHDSCFANTAGGAYVEGSMIRPTDAGTTTSSTWKSGGPLYLMLSGTYEIN